MVSPSVTSRVIVSGTKSLPRQTVHLREKAPVPRGGSWSATSSPSFGPTSSTSPLLMPPPEAPADAGGGRFGKPRLKGKDGQIYIDDAGKCYKCYIYPRGDREVHPWYEVDASGSRILGGSVRPPDTPAKIWSKMTDLQQQADARDCSLGRPGRKMADADGGAASSAKLSPSAPPGPPAPS